jgi:hypothetical protein
MNCIDAAAFLIPNPWDAGSARILTGLDSSARDVELSGGGGFWPTRL